MNKITGFSSVQNYYQKEWFPNFFVMQGVYNALKSSAL